MTSIHTDYRDFWRAAVLADATRLGSVAMTDYRRINRAMGRTPGDKGIFSQLTELRAAGWAGTFRATATGWDNGWPLTFPGSAK